ncbi:hypothetical protein GCM10027174_09560 [Salinifilum aidingensis]
MSTTARPVMHTAEVAVNSARTTSMRAPGSVATGSINKTVPSRAARPNPKSTVRAGRAADGRAVRGTAVISTSLSPFRPSSGQAQPNAPAVTADGVGDRLA